MLGMLGKQFRVKIRFARYSDNEKNIGGSNRYHVIWKTEQLEKELIVWFVGIRWKKNGYIQYYSNIGGKEFHETSRVKVAMVTTSIYREPFPVPIDSLCEY